MSFIEHIWIYLSPLLVFNMGLFVSVILGDFLKINLYKNLSLYFWHTFICLLYFWYVSSYGGDALGYYDLAKAGEFEFSLGTDAVVALTFFLARFLGFSILSTFLIFNIIGLIGLLFFAGSLEFSMQNKKNINSKLIWLVIFLPSVSFWSSAIGKDSISFMSVGLALWAALDLKRRLGLMTFAVVIMLLVRPHMAGMMVIALAVAALSESRASLPKKAFMGILSASAAALLVPFALKFAGLGDGVDLESVSSYIDTRQSYNMEGGGGIDIASMSLPEQMFTYMFRPLVFEVNSIFSAAAALDNLFFLFLFISGGWAMLRGKRSDLGENRVFMWIYALMAWVVLAMTTANLGIALRQKWMFAPMLIFLFTSVLGRRRPPAQSFNLAVHASAVKVPARHRQR